MEHNKDTIVVLRLIARLGVLKSFTKPEWEACRIGGRIRIIRIVLKQLSSSIHTMNNPSRLFVIFVGGLDKKFLKGKDLTTESFHVVMRSLESDVMMNKASKT